MSTEVRRVALDYTYVLYNDSSNVSGFLALLTLSPILLNPAYAALVVQTRELLFVEMWAGQMLCEGFNWILKHTVQQNRPSSDMGQGYGFPSSHSQWMGYFSTFLICHFLFRHRFVPMGSRALDLAWKATLYMGLMTWACLVAFSRWYLSYHTASQVLWGLGIGALFGAYYYVLVELIPHTRPESFCGQARSAVLSSRICTWLRIRDGWAVWNDSGIEVQWQQWRIEWDRRRFLESRAARPSKRE
ncbi:hypothetical protein AcW1_006375 [Taiwanofungus camphoratus]|nr:hypothetical protein AcV5_008960 [Antrodia cinnamomea]KAI0924188.1 hypothetical protein AcW2_005138 [Antrodia cinnamomea]KAI0954498.1 hypothetical protein AcW1_006375 [Antrodia cinnamomea]